MIVKVLQIMHLSKGCVRRPVAAIANDSFQVIGEYEDASGHHCMSKNTGLITLVVKLNKLNRPQKIFRLAPMNKDDIKEAKMNQRQERQKDKKRQKNKNAKRHTDD